MSWTAIFLVVLILCVLYLSLRLRSLENAVVTLARIVDEPRRRDRAIQKEIKNLEDELEYLSDLASQGAASPEDFDEADLIRAKLDRRIRTLAGRRETPAEQPPSSPPSP